MGAIAAALAAAQGVLDLSKRAKDDHLAASRFGRIHRDLRHAGHRAARGEDVDEILAKINEAWDQASIDAPSIMDRYWRRARRLLKKQASAGSET
jgi:hypothetical protein